MIIVDKLAYSSKLRFYSPHLKCFFSIANLLICVCSRTFVMSLLIFVLMSIGTVYYGKVSISYYVKLLSVPAVFLIISTVTMILNVSQSPLDLWAVPIGNYYITASSQGVMGALRLIATSFGSVGCLCFLTLTTPMTDILEVLRTIHIPAVFIELMLLIYRFIFILMDIASAILTAQDCRLGHKDVKTSVTSTGNMLAVLLIRAYQKAGNLYDAMETRCYDGTLGVLCTVKKAPKRQLAAIVSLELVLVIVAVICVRLGW